MTLPSFLIVGAMKAGTTTLFEDLSTHPDIFTPDRKEPGDLNHDVVLTPPGRSAYEQHFHRCRSNQITFEASTYYTMMPQYSGAAQRARSLMGPDLMVLYLVREPIARTRSHHRHMMDAGGASPDINKAVQEDPRLVDYSRYRFQIEPWLEALGEDQVMVIRFESYVDDRVAVVEAAQSFLGLSPRGDLVRAGSAANISKGKWVDTTFSRRLESTALYRKVIRPILPTRLKSRVKKLVMHSSTADPMQPSRETVDHIIDATAEDVAGIAPLLHPRLEPGTLPWDPAEARRTALGDRE